MSDAAPLPRLGEVFFDVRGNSRSMRLSWYADTGVAVFSIWQAGMCTGTFRLPIGDLSRMIEILERGPSAQGRSRPPVSGARRGPERGPGEYPADEDEIGLLDSPGGPGAQAGYPGGDYGRTGQYAQGGFDGGTADYLAGDYEPAAYGDSGYEQAGYPDARGSGASYGSDRPRGADYGSGGYQSADYGASQPDGHEPAAYGYIPAEYERGGYAEQDSVRRGSHAGADDASGGYSAGAQDYLTGEPPVAGYPDGTRADSGRDYPSAGYGSQPAFPASGRPRDDSRLPPDPGGMPSAETDGIGYPEERFVPPYVRGGGDSYLNESRAPAAGYEGDLDDAGYPVGGPAVSPSDGYPEEQWPGEAYSYGADYRRR